MKGLLRSRFLRDSATLQIGALCISAGNLLGVIALTHVLGARNQGELYLSIATYSLLWFLIGLGLTPVAIGHVARAAGHGDRDEAAAWLAHLGKVTAVLALALLVFAQLLLPAATEAWLGGRVQDAQRVARDAVLLCATPLLEVPRLVALSGLTGTRRMAAVARVENGHEALRVALTVSGALITGDARGPVLGMLAASALGSCLGIEAWIREARAGHLPGPRAVLRPRVRLGWAAGLREGVQMGFVRNINVATSQVLPSLILGRFGSPAWVAYLRVAQRFTDVARMLAQGISRTALPALSDSGVLHDPTRLRRAYWRASGLSGITVGAGLLVGLALAPKLVALLLPRDYATPVWTCLWILTPGVLVLGFSAVNDTFYLVTGNLRVVLAFSVVGLFVNSAMMAGLAALWPDIGVACGLSFTYAWSLLYIAYAGWWLHRRARGRGRPALSTVG